MKKRVILSILVALIAICAFAISVSAATTNEFGTPETSTTIDLTNMATDNDVYCVLYDGQEYHTYPSQYIVTSAATMTWDFSKINAAFTKEYTAASVVRIQVPSHVTTIPCITSNYFSWKNVTTLIEVSFPEDTIVENFVWGAFEKCTALEAIFVPNTVKTFGNNTFSGCSSLKSVVFEEGSQVTSLPNNAFSNTVALTEIILPDSITSIGSTILGGHNGKLSKVVLSPNLSKVTGGSLLNALGRNSDDFIEVYMPACFATAEGSIQSGNIIGRGDKNDLRRYTIFFTGTREEAIAFVTKYSGDISLADANIVAYDPTKTSAQEYLGMDPYTADITVNTNRVIVYGYNTCDAFYASEHKNGEVTQKFEGASYLTNYISASTCQRCALDFVVGEPICGPMFVDKGYSKCLEGSSMTYGISLNREEIEKYIAATGNDISYGFILGLAGTEEESGKIISSDGESLISNSIVTDFADMKDSLNVFNLKLTGIDTDAQRNLSIYCNAYVLENGTASYIGSVDEKTYLPIAITFNNAPTKEEL